MTPTEGDLAVGDGVVSAERGDNAEHSFVSALACHDAPWWRPYAATLALADASAMVVATVVAETVRFGTVRPSSPSTSGLSFGTAIVVLTSAWLAALVLGGAYQRRLLGSGSDEYRRVADSAVRFLAVVAVVALLVQIDVVRGFVAIAIAVAAVMSLLLRYLLRHWFHRQRRRGRFVRRVFIVGSRHHARELVRTLGRNPHAGLAAVAACVPGHPGDLDVEGAHLPVFTDTERVLEGVLSCRADAVAIADSDTLSNAALRQLAWRLEGTGIALMVAPAVTDLAGPRIAIRPISDLPLLEVEEPELKGVQRLTKEAADRVSAAAGLIVLAPVLLVVALIIRLTSRGPALFRQVRVGLGGRHFVMVKFRTMRDGAEALLPGLAHLNELDGVLFKIRDDPRITPIGRFLRRWSIDELPQLWNVLRGDMSVVGPRPPLPSEVERYSHDVRRRLLVKPGLTGLWQVNGRAGLPWEEAVRLDLYYVENWSLSMDTMIIARTLSAVLRGHGAS